MCIGLCECPEEVRREYRSRSTQFLSAQALKAHVRLPCGHVSCSRRASVSIARWPIGRDSVVTRVPVSAGLLQGLELLVLRVASFQLLLQLFARWQWWEARVKSSDENACEQCKNTWYLDASCSLLPPDIAMKPMPTTAIAPIAIPTTTPVLIPEDSFFSVVGAVPGTGVGLEVPLTSHHSPAFPKPPQSFSELPQPASNLHSSCRRYIHTNRQCGKGSSVRTTE
jgi:hypothetical protein